MVLCILRRMQLPPDLPLGVRDVVSGGLAAAVADAPPSASAGPDPRDLREFALRVDALHRRATVVPMRYGCVLADDAAVRRLLEAGSARMAALLDRLDGCAEIGLRVLLPAERPGRQAAPGDLGPPVDPEGHSGSAGRAAAERPGHAHLASVRARLAEERAARDRTLGLRAELDRTLAGHYRDIREQVASRNGHALVSLDYLVPRDSCAQFADALRGATAELGSEAAGSALVSGPWPPYSFVNGIGIGAAEDHADLLV